MRVTFVWREKVFVSETLHGMRLKTCDEKEQANQYMRTRVACALYTRIPDDGANTHCGSMYKLCMYVYIRMRTHVYISEASGAFINAHAHKRTRSKNLHSSTRMHINGRVRRIYSRDSA